ncbi:FkbM family methyltransferase [Phormidium pseudopriestleyi FRX01]|uniref:FkbM family methyltransferase n=2 Tax=Phormidium TaxID=1198 RepID=A0ABS3FPY4_9CYAN|nr:FkbM family methyltransferase [Phormidium pseudopriestleyi FRX01]
MENSPVNSYLTYLNINCPTLDAESLVHINTILHNTRWEDPISALDFNNIAVVALVEAEQCSDISLRNMYIEMALEALNEGRKLEEYPLCSAHLSIILALMGEMEQAMQLAFPLWMTTLHFIYGNSESILPAIAYIPSDINFLKSAGSSKTLQETLSAKTGAVQCLLLLTEALSRSLLVFYNKQGLRMLHLAQQIFPSLAAVNLKLGISSIVNSQLEGLLYLHRAREADPDNATILQSLYLAYRELQQTDVANFWLSEGEKLRQKNPECLEVQWARLAENKNFTYVPFEHQLLLAVEPSFRSIVTSVLIAEGDWFETEMEFWRTWIKPGMTVIDVGANVGVYTFSAARQVGEGGRVFAVEPFSGCIRCLEETCRVNHLSWVKVYAAAASDQNGTVLLSLSSASELNEIVPSSKAAEMNPNGFEKVTCLTLDSLIEAETLTQVDFLKIDAEGHELSVLLGSERLLSEFSPVILYENRAGSQGSNRPVAEYLMGRGYQLFRYQPYVQQLIPINMEEEDWQKYLNLIALPVQPINS